MIGRSIDHTTTSTTPERLLECRRLHENSTLHAEVCRSLRKMGVRTISVALTESRKSSMVSSRAPAPPEYLSGVRDKYKKNSLKRRSCQGPRARLPWRRNMHAQLYHSHQSLDPDQPRPIEASSASFRLSPCLLEAGKGLRSMPNNKQLRA